MLGVVVVLMMVAALGACDGGGEDPPPPGYTPIPDKDLFAQVAALPGVTKSDISYSESVGTPNDYIGRVEVESAVDALAILDQVLAILRQGEPGAAITVVAVQDGVQISPRELGLLSTTDEDLTERYGPQPGDGKPPASTPTP